MKHPSHHCSKNDLLKKKKKEEKKNYRGTLGTTGSSVNVLLDQDC